MPEKTLGLVKCVLHGSFVHHWISFDYDIVTNMIQLFPCIPLNTINKLFYTRVSIILYSFAFTCIWRDFPKTVKTVEYNYGIMHDGVTKKLFEYLGQNLGHVRIFILSLKSAKLDMPYVCHLHTSRYSDSIPL